MKKLLIFLLFFFHQLNTSILFSIKDKIIQTKISDRCLGGKFKIHLRWAVGFKIL
jgi:hypothetical protein